MNDSPSTECLVCRKHSGEVDVPGGVIYEDNLIYISHAQLWGGEKEHYLGHVFVESRRHIAEVSDLTEKEAQVIGVYTSRIARALLYTEKMEHIYIFVIGDGVPHVHYHVIGRYPGAPRAYWGSKVDDWPKAPKGDAAEIKKVADRLRIYLREHFVDKQ